MRIQSYMVKFCIRSCLSLFCEQSYIALSLKLADKGGLPVGHCKDALKYYAKNDLIIRERSFVLIRLATISG